MNTTKRQPDKTWVIERLVCGDWRPLDGRTPASMSAACQEAALRTMGDGFLYRVVEIERDQRTLIFEAG